MNLEVKTSIRFHIVSRLKTKLMAYEIPKTFIHCDDFPRTSNGKVSIIKSQELVQIKMN